MRLLCTYLWILLAVSQVTARSEYHLGTAGNPWEDTLLEEGLAGVYLVFDKDGNEVRRVPVGITPYGAGTDTLIDFSGTAIQPRFIDPNVNLAKADPETDLGSGSSIIPLPYIGGGANGGQNQNFNVFKMLDGDLTSAQFRRFVQDPNSQPGIGEGWACGCSFDFGADLPVNRIRFYPRLAKEEDLRLIDRFNEPQMPIERFGQFSFVENYVEWYDILVGNSSHPTLTTLHSNRENLDVVVDFRFPTQSIRWLTFRTFPLRTWEIAEFEIYGEGFVEKTVYTTQILDFGQPVNWGKIRWSGELPKGTRIEIRTRAGHTPDPSLYFDENINGQLFPITSQEYKQVEPSARLPTAYDTENWSFWSPPYDFAAGRRDETLSAASWQDGIPLHSPSPRRYIQIAIRFFGTTKAAPRLDQLSLLFSEAPAAQQIVGEIWPNEVSSFEPTTFTYIVRPAFEAKDAGFDRLEILTHTRVDTVRAIVLDGEELDLSLFIPQVLDDRLVLSFPKMAGEQDSFKQLEVVFDTSVLRFGTEFVGWVFSTEDPDQIKQRINPGNATFRFSGNILSVHPPVGGALFADVLVPKVFTPNGDGINETLVISYKLREVTVGRQVTIRIRDLTGALVMELESLSRSGEFVRQWDGRNTAGQRVPPGIYTYQLSLSSKESEDKIGFFSVAY